MKVSSVWALGSGGIMNLAYACVSITHLGISGGLVYLGKGWHDARETGHAVLVRGHLPVNHIGTSNHI